MPVEPAEVGQDVAGGDLAQVVVARRQPPCRYLQHQPDQNQRRRPITVMVCVAPLIGRLSNGRFRTNLDTLFGSRETVTVRVDPHACQCGCGAEIPLGRKFLNQEHYDKSKGLAAADAEWALDRLRQGESVKRLAREFGVAHTTIYRLLRREG
jgi:Helix-turn-helix domain